jgi:hypothetical protein
LGKLNHSIHGTDNVFESTSLPTISGFTGLGVYNGHQYYRTNTAMTWVQVRDVCLAAGGHLATISSLQENTYITGQDCWFGFNDIVTEGQWRWVTNETVVFTNWSPGEPNNGDGQYNREQDWAHIMQNGYWDDGDEGTQLPGILEIDNLPITSMLSFSPYTGFLDTITTQSVTMTTTGNLLSDGLYQTSVSIASNAPEPRDTIYIPVTVKVDYTPPLAPLGLSFDKCRAI